MSLTRSITFNNVTASITLPTELNNDSQLDWTITMTSGNNVVSTSGTVDIVVPESEPTPELVPVPVPALTPDTAAFVAVEERNKHIAVIRVLLDMSETLKGKESKAVAAIKILDYVSGEALEFTKSSERFKDTVIKKCYEFKRVNSDMPAVVENAYDVLTKPVAEPVKPVAEPVKPVPTTVAGSLYNSDVSLFITLAHEHQLGHFIKEPSRYWSYYENAVKLGNVLGATKVEQMNNYLGQFSELGARTQLMKSLFEKNKLVFNDSIMPQYKKWIKTYIPPGKTNRYKNMCAFIDANKSLFTA